MEFRAYLKKEEEAGETTDFGQKVYGDAESRFFIIKCMTTETPKAPEETESRIERFTFKDSILGGPNREAGNYHHKTAKADLGHPYPYGEREESFTQNIEAEAKELKDLHKLLHLITIGGIRPTESYEGPQGGLSAAEANELVQTLTKKNELLRKDHNNFSESAQAIAKELKEKGRKLRLFVDRMKGLKERHQRKWWSLSSGAIVRALDELVKSE